MDAKDGKPDKRVSRDRRDDATQRSGYGTSLSGPARDHFLQGLQGYLLYTRLSDPLEQDKVDMISFPLLVFAERIDDAAPIGGRQRGGQP